MISVFGPLLVALLSGLVLASAALWALAIQKVASGAAIVRLEPRRAVPWGLLDVVVIFGFVTLLLIGAQTAVAEWANFPPGVGLKDLSAHQLAQAIFANSVAMLLGCAAAVAVLVARTGAGIDDLGASLRRMLDDLRLGFLAFLMIAPPMYVLQWGLTQVWPSEHPVQTLLMEDRQASMLAVTLFTAVIAAPLSEEFLFRVILQGWLEKVSLFFSPSAGGSDLAGPPDESPSATNDGPAHSPPGKPDTLGNPYATPQADLFFTGALSPTDDGAAADVAARTAHWPMFASALVFALLHAGHGPDPIPLFFLAVGLGFLYQRTHRMLPCIVVHFLVNSTSMVALLVSLLAQPAA
ncbi:MAG: CPBP family intramembrane metalloprotease [Planctomycetales bacterium]|nr:CPBP family intramembrane metalloprotease [Planctomycetales bacterium]